ncbi:MAG: hypothetical protein ACPLY9_07160, partial [Nitrososphaerales archaeon]
SAFIPPLKSVGFLRYFCKHRAKVSLADCYELATTMTRKAQLITTDEPLAETAKAEDVSVKLIRI